jgi:hypothetical protein
MKKKAFYPALMKGGTKTSHTSLVYNSQHFKQTLGSIGTAEKVSLDGI